MDEKRSAPSSFGRQEESPPFSGDECVCGMGWGLWLGVVEVRLEWEWGSGAGQSGRGLFGAVFGEA